MARTEGRSSGQFVEASGAGRKWRANHATQRTTTAHKKMRPRSDAATDGDRLGRMIRDGGP